MNSERPSERDMILLLHSVLYAIQDSMEEADRKVFLFVSKRIPNIMGKFGFTIDKNRNVEENVKSFLKILEDSGYMADLKFEKVDERTYRLTIGRCLLEDRGSVHEILKPKKAYCPYSLIVGSILQELVEDRVVVQPSKLGDRGSVTEIRVYKHAFI